MILSQRTDSRTAATAIAVRLTGAYCQNDYCAAWGKLGDYCLRHALDYDCPDAQYLNIYHDDPRYVPAEACRADVCIAHPVCEQLHDEGDVHIVHVPHGPFVVFTVQGPYDTALADAYMKIYGTILPASTLPVLEGQPTLERYLNDPEATDPADILTEIWIPLKA